MKYSDVDDITARFKRSELSTTFGYQSQEYKTKSAAIDAVGDEVFAKVIASFSGRADPVEVRKMYEREMTVKMQQTKELTLWDKVVNKVVPFVDVRVPTIQQTKLEIEKNTFNPNRSTLVDEYPVQFEQIKRALQERGLDSSDVQVLKKLTEWKNSQQ